MKVTIFDNNPGSGAMNKFLRLAWMVGCWFQKAIGAVDDYYGADSWTDAKAWLIKKSAPLDVIQFWGHGSPGTVWLAQKPVPAQEWLSLKSLLTPQSLLWFRSCSVFQGRLGFYFSKELADGLNCTIGGHTRIVGIWQGGLYTRKPNTLPHWSIKEGGEPSVLREDFKFWNKNTIFCLRTSIPKGW